MQHIYNLSLGDDKRYFYYLRAEFWLIFFPLAPEMRGLDLYRNKCYALPNCLGPTGVWSLLSVSF